MNILLLLGISLFLYLQSNRPGTYLYDPEWGSIWPLSLAVLTIFHSFYVYLKGKVFDLSSGGLFSKEVILRVLTAPLHAVTFRDTFAANILTSITRVISDVLRAGCWIYSGVAFSKDSAASSIPVCESENFTIFVSMCICYVLWIRVMQNLRKCIESRGVVNPHVYNMCKYMLSIAVVIYGQVYMGDINLFQPPLTPVEIGFLLLVLANALVKWWWDVKKDWGLWNEKLTNWNAIKAYFKKGHLIGVRDVPNKLPAESQILQTPSAKENVTKLLLREKLIFNSAAVYHLCIVLNLLLRFLWVLSLRPRIAIQLVGPMFNTYLGSLEILRRFMWGIFKVEWEHIKR